MPAPRFLPPSPYSVSDDVEEAPPVFAVQMSRAEKLWAVNYPREGKSNKVRPGNVGAGKIKSEARMNKGGVKIEGAPLWITEPKIPCKRVSSCICGRKKKRLRYSTRREELPKSILPYPQNGRIKFMACNNIFVCARPSAIATLLTLWMRGYIEILCKWLAALSSSVLPRSLFFFCGWFVIPLLLLFKATYQGYHRSGRRIEIDCAWIGN